MVPRGAAEMFTQFSTPVTFTPPAGGNTTTYTYTMYPNFPPPTLSVNGTVEDGGTFTLGSTLTMAAPTGTIYYTTDGSDPRTSESDVTIESITLSGTTATVTLDSTSSGFTNGEEIYISGASQSQYDGEFAIAGVSVNAAAATTTFTYTVTGSPASPATPLTGQPLLASTGTGGSISATAQEYSGPITLSAGETINARAYIAATGTWSALLSATFYVDLSAIRVTEVMYDPASATAAEIAAGYVVSDTSDPWKDFQYIEIQNTGTQTLPLAGLQIAGGISFTFPEYQGGVDTNPLLTLAPGAYMVAVADPTAFAIRYGAELESKFGPNWQNLIVAGEFNNHHLNDSSDVVELIAPTGAVIQNFTYQSSWYPPTHRGGYALMAQSATQALSLFGSSAGWEASGTYDGTPGFADPVVNPLPSAVVINEVLSNPTGAPGDMIELYNTTSQAINIGDWFVANNNNSSNLMEYQIPAGTVIAAGGYYVLTEDYNFGPGASDPGCLAPFVLDPDGDTVYLSNDYDLAISSITLSGTTATVTLNTAGYSQGAGLQNGEVLNIAGAAQTQYDGNFTIANVTVNSAAGTTTFTYTVTGSPASPATPADGQSLNAGQAGGYQEQQTVNSMPPGTSYGLYTKQQGVFPVVGITGYPLVGGGDTATATLDSTATGLSDGDEVVIAGAAQTAYDGDFTIANVAVNSAAGTTTFTYTVTGSPASPATGIITATEYHTNFTLLQTPSFGASPTASPTSRRW